MERFGPGLGAVYPMHARARRIIRRLNDAYGSRDLASARASGASSTGSPLRTRDHVWHAERSFRRHLRCNETLGDVLISELSERLLLATRVFTKDREFGRFYRRRNADTLRASRLWASGGRPAPLCAYRLVVVRTHAKAFGRNRQRRRRA